MSIMQRACVVPSIALRVASQPPASCRAQTDARRGLVEVRGGMQSCWAQWVPPRVGTGRPPRSGAQYRPSETASLRRVWGSMSTR